MSADCYACVVKDKTLPVTIGNINEPIGACINCHAFACGHHGYRDKASSRFECRMCYPALLTASAASLSLPTVQAVFELDILKAMTYLHEPREIVPVNKRSGYKSNLSEFYESFPLFREQIQTELAKTALILADMEDEELKVTIENFLPPAREMIHAAGILVKETREYDQTKQPDEPLALAEYPRILILIAHAVRPKNY